jgi:hypothetical protein
MSENNDSGESRPKLRVLAGGTPSDEELAALATVLLTRAEADTPEPQPLRRPLPAWVASGLAKGTRTKA